MNSIFTKYRKLFALSGFIFISACGGIYSDYDTDNPDPMDRPSMLNRKDFTKALLPKNPEEPVKSIEPPLPKITEVLSAPKAPKIQSNKTISISVTEDVPLKDVFLEISRLADLEIEIGSRITGGVNLKAKDRPVSEIIERITDMAGLRYSVKNGIIRIERDIPYLVNYSVDYLSMKRSSSGSINVNTAVLGSGGSDSGGSSSGSSSSGGGSSGGSLSTGSSASIEASTSSDLWANVENNIKAIIEAGGTTTPSTAGNADSKPYITLNQQAGIIAVMTTQKAHEKVQEYLEKVKEYASMQVLIEAKVVEVSLSDKFASGVDWRYLINDGKIAIDPVFAGNTDTDIAGNLSKITIDDNDSLDAVVSLASVFGTTRTLSSPRLLVMNNQQAVLTFAVNEVFFEVSIDQDQTSTTGGTGSTTQNKSRVTSKRNVVPIGIIITLQPSVDAKTKEITMNIRPTLSRVVNRRTDPGSVIVASISDLDDEAKAAAITTVPEVEVREMDSVLKIKNSEVMVIGGMIQQKDTNTDQGIPAVSEVPLFGNLFKNVEKLTSAVQTVIFLKATVVPGYGVDGSDQKFYNKFNNDPRPLNF